MTEDSKGYEVGGPPHGVVSLDVDQYYSADFRWDKKLHHQFDKWLGRVGLLALGITKVWFGEGWVVTREFGVPVRLGPDRQPEEHYMLYRITEPPPREVIEWCINARKETTT